MFRIKTFFKNFFLIFIFGFNYEKKIERAHKILLKKNQLKTIQKIFFEIEKSEIKIDKSSFSLFHKYFNENQNYHLTVGQINFSGLFHFSSFSSLIQICLAFNKNLYYPLPKEWLIILKKNNIKVNFLISKNLYFLSAIFFFLNDSLKIFSKLFIKSIKIQNINNLVYLDGLPKNLDSKFKKDDSKYNFFSWCKNYLKIKKYTTFIHNNKNISDEKLRDFETIYVDCFYLINFTLFNRLYYFYLFIKIILIFIYFLFKGNIKHFFLLENFFINVWLNKSKSKMPNYAFYNNANYLVRPWWTLSLEKRMKKNVSCTIIHQIISLLILIKNLY
jgi:hypothetical protein